MIQRVYENVKKCSYIDDVYVATCDQEIKEFIEKIKGNVTMTKKHILEQVIDVQKH